MGFNVYFWTLTKKSNSTLIPTTGRYDYTCTIKDGSGIMNPTIELNIGATSDPSAYNYCQIPNFDRYYYINEWNYSRGLWTASLSVDVLATYKTQIGSTSMYVLRASAASDGAIVDNLYPMKVGCTYVHNTAASPYIAVGTYIVGCVGKNADYGSVSYYAMTKAELTTLCTYLIQDAIQDGVNGFTLNDCSIALQNSLVDPIQYIKSCVFIPYSRSDLSTTTDSTFNIFNWTVPGLTGYRVAGHTVIKTATLSISKHPSTTARGNYVNTAPYTLLTLYVPPFGVINIDSTVTCNATQLDLELRTDTISGRGVLTIKCNGCVLHKLEAQIGVPIQLSQVTRDYVGAATSMVSGVTSAITGALTGNAAGAVTGAINGIGNAIQALAPRQQSVGSGGGFVHLASTPWQLDHQFFTPVDDDNSHNGRPYCKVATPSSLGGYMLIQDGDVAIPGTKAEADELRGLLESGFYYE